MRLPLRAPRNPELVPSGQMERWGGVEGLPVEILGHFRWLLQKRQLKQDVYLAGPPTSTRRQLVLALAELCGWECEYLAITRDTAESDLKQRREIVGDSVLWSDAAPVRAAVHGRLLILDGLENAERNVLPTLNNLLENREMMLEDGRFLMRQEAVQSLEAAEAAEAAGTGAGAGSGVGASGSARLVAVHPDFQVIALGLPVPPYQGRPLDPPLRSRFQSRFVEELQLQDALGCVDAGGVRPEHLRAVAAVYEGLRAMRTEAGTLAGSAALGSAGISSVPCFSLDGLRHCLQLLRLHRDTGDVSVAAALSRSIPLGQDWRQAVSSVMQ
jgi:hypothetical protein